MCLREFAPCRNFVSKSDLKFGGQKVTIVDVRYFAVALLECLWPNTINCVAHCGMGQYTGACVFTNMARDYSKVSLLWGKF